MTDIKVYNSTIRTLFDNVKEMCGTPLVDYLQYRSSTNGISTFEFTKHANKEAVAFLILKFNLPGHGYTQDID